MRTRRGRTLRGLTATAAGAALVALAACGSDSGLSAGATGALHDRVDAVRASAVAGDREAAQAALNAFRAEVHRLVEAGALDPAEAVTLLAQADRVGVDVDAEVPAVAPPEPVARPVARSVGTTSADGADFSRALAALIRERMQERDGDRRDRDGRGDQEDREDRDDRREGDGDDD